MSNPNLILTPTDFVAIANQALEHAFGFVQIEGELANFRISKNKWVYFDIKDDLSKVACFASVFALPGPLQDGMLVKIAGQPHLHPQFGFSVTAQNIQPSGEGSIKKAFELLKANLEKEGLFDPNRKRQLPYPPQKVALVASLESAAYVDFVKILSARWPFVDLNVYDTQVQGETAPAQIIKAVSAANAEAELADVLVVTRGGGGQDDLAAFNDERVVRSIASSRIPTMVAIGHEIDESLSELAADKRASTPSNAAELLVPDKKSELKALVQAKIYIKDNLKGALVLEKSNVNNLRSMYSSYLWSAYSRAENDYKSSRQLITAFSPSNVLKRGYAIVRASSGDLLKSSESIKINDNISVKLYDGGFDAQVKKIHR